jgi:hypothetical protein
MVDFSDRVEQLEGTSLGGSTGTIASLSCAWTSLNGVAASSLDLVIFTVCVLEHVDTLEGTYRTMFAWLKPGGYASHNIDFSAHYLSLLEWSLGVFRVGSGVCSRAT